VTLRQNVKQALSYLGLEVGLRRPGYANSRRTERLSYFETATGNYYLPTDARGDGIARAIRRNEIFDEPIFECARKYIQPASIVLDVGSNFGQMAILMSSLVGSAGRVYAFEADDFIFKILERNVIANAANVETVFGAVHQTSGETLHFPVQDFKRFETYGSYGIDYANGRGRPVPSIAIDDLDFSMPISFMKVDVQGGDLLAMKGAAKTIAKHKMPILFEYEYLFEDELGLSFQEYVDFVLGMDYYFAKVISGQNFLVLPRSKEPGSSS
jgi:FkbM family methyltransferase